MIDSYVVAVVNLLRDLHAYATYVVKKFGESLAVSLDISNCIDGDWHDSLLSKLNCTKYLLASVHG